MMSRSGAHALAARDRFKAASAEQLRLDSQNQLKRLSVEHDEYLKRGRQIQTRIKKERLERKDMQVERLLEKQRRHEGHRAKIDKQHAANNEEYFAETQRRAKSRKSAFVTLADAPAKA